MPFLIFIILIFSFLFQFTCYRVVILILYFIYIYILIFDLVVYKFTLTYCLFFLIYMLYVLIICSFCIQITIHYYDTIQIIYVYKLICLIDSKWISIYLFVIFFVILNYTDMYHFPIFFNCWFSCFILLILNYLLFIDF